MQHSLSFHLIRRLTPPPSFPTLRKTTFCYATTLHVVHLTGEGFTPHPPQAVSLLFLRYAKLHFAMLQHSVLFNSKGKALKLKISSYPRFLNFTPHSPSFPHGKEASRLRYEMRRRMCELRALNSSKYAAYFPPTHCSHMKKKMLLGDTLTFPRREKIVQNGRNAPDDVLRVLQAVRLVFIFSLPIVPTWKRSK